MKATAKELIKIGRSHFKQFQLHYSADFLQLLDIIGAQQEQIEDLRRDIRELSTRGQDLR